MRHAHGCFGSCKTDLRILDVDSENHQGLARSISIRRRLCQDLNMVLISKTSPGLCRMEKLE